MAPVTEHNPVKHRNRTLRELLRGFRSSLPALAVQLKQASAWVSVAKSVITAAVCVWKLAKFLSDLYKR